MEIFGIILEYLIDEEWEEAEFNKTMLLNPQSTRKIMMSSDRDSENESEDEES